MILLTLAVSLLIQNLVSARDERTIHFVKSFIENERKPTSLAYNICWPKTPLLHIFSMVAIIDVEIQLVKEVAKVNAKASIATDAPWMEPSYYQAHGILFLIDLDCDHAMEIITKASPRNWLRAPYRWLVLSSRQQATAALWKQPLLADSDFVLAEYSAVGFQMTERKINLHLKSIEATRRSEQQTSSEKNPKKLKVYKSTPLGPMHAVPRGFYNGVLYDVRPHRELFRRRRDLKGHPLTMANVVQDSNKTLHHLLMEDRLEPQYDSIAKISWSMAKVAFETLNATPRHIFSYRYGYKQNGTWSGMIAEIQSGRADVGTNCVMSKQRLEAVGFIDMIAPINVRFVFRQPPLSYVSNIFSLPFSPGVWVALVVCAAVSMLTLYLATKHEARFGKTAPQMDGNIGDAFLMTMCAVSQQGCALEPKKTSGRMMVFVIFTALMALYAAYSANIVVLLQAPSSSIRTLGQLAFSKMDLAANDVDYNHFIFRLYNDSVRKEILRKIEPDKGRKQYYEINEGVERIRQGLFAFHSIVEPVYHRIEQTFLEMEKCDLMEVDFFNAFDPCTPLKKDSPYFELLRVVFKQIRESGIQVALAKRIQVSKPPCSDKGAAFSSVGLLDLRPVLLFMAYGVAASVAIAAVEVAVSRLYQQRRQRMKSFKSKTVGQ